MADSYFLRNDGKIRGPFQIAQIANLLASGRIQASAEVSYDRRTWYRLQDNPQLLMQQFPVAPPPVATPAPAPVSVTAPTPAPLPPINIPTGFDLVLDDDPVQQPAHQARPAARATQMPPPRPVTQVQPRNPSRLGAPPPMPIPVAQPRRTVHEQPPPSTFAEAILPLPAIEEPDYEITLDLPPARPAAQPQSPPRAQPLADQGDWFGDVNLGSLGDE